MVPNYSFVGDICSLEFWYYKVLMLMTGYLKDATIAVDALSIWFETRLDLLKFGIYFIIKTTSTITKI